MKFTQENWMKLILDVASFNGDWRKFDDFYFTLFVDWSIYGDGLFVSELEATAVFNPNEDDSIRVLKEEEKFLLTEKFGQHRAALSDQDTDAQAFSKLFAFTLNIDGQLEVSFKPANFRNMNMRTEVEKRVSFDSKAQAEWWMIGSSKLTPGCRFEEMSKIKNPYLLPLVDKNIYIELHISRYNNSTNLGTLKGFIQNTDVNANAPDLQGWRQVVLINQQTEKH